MRTIRQAREERHTVASVFRQSSSDYIQWQFCQRHFNHYSPERHIPFSEQRRDRSSFTLLFLLLLLLVVKLNSNVNRLDTLVRRFRFIRSIPHLRNRLLGNFVLFVFNSDDRISSRTTTNADKSFRRAAPTFRRAPINHLVQRAGKHPSN